MNFLLRRDVKLAIAIAGSSVLLYGLYQLWKMVGAQQRKKDEETQSNPAKDEGTEDEEEHVPYEYFFSYLARTLKISIKIRWAQAG